MQERISLKLIQHLKEGTIPNSWINAKSCIEQDYIHLNKLLNSESPPLIYGVNTLVGHVDNETVDKEKFDSFQTELIENHCIGTAPYYSKEEAKYIGYAKANALSMGGTAISLELYENIIKVITNDDFNPKIPKYSSYSSGDVIPGAHWARDLLNYLMKNHHYNIKRKEGLSLINGSFVHLGLGLSVVNELKGIWNSFLYASQLNANAVQANISNYTSFLSSNPDDYMSKVGSYIQDRLVKQNQTYTKQDPISIRAFSQVTTTFYESIQNYLNSLDKELMRRSDNPLVLHHSNIPLSQGSFLALHVSMTTSQLIETLLMAMWTVERRFHHLLSGQVEGIPLNGSTGASSLGYIQVPKLVTAKLEETRVAAGRRTFASGGSTSYGIEDLWSYGVSTVEVLKTVLRNFRAILSMEITVTNLCASSLRNQNEKIDKALMSNTSINEKFSAIEKLINDNELELENEVISPFN